MTNGDEWTTISVRTSTRDRFNDLKANTGDGTISPLSSDEFVKSLLDAWEENDEAVYPLSNSSDIGAEEIAEAVEVPAALSYDDVVAASRQALREELPGEALQG